MEIVSTLRDNRINSENHLIVMSIGEYLSFARAILHKNPYQRRRVRSSKTVYSLLRKDLELGCVIPPIVLALTSNIENFNENNLETLIDQSDHLVILDGLQRTYTMIDLVDNIQDQEDLDKVLAHRIRVEIYLGLNRLGVLYRMLTLNTGQTAMSLRQQIEMLYLDYIDAPIGDNIQLLREFDETRAVNVNQYNFKEVVDGFNSYIDRDELPIDRGEILENIKSLELLARENQEIDLFKEYLLSWHAFILKIHSLCGDNETSNEFIEEFGEPFGRNVLQVFKKSQAMTGFGAAIGRLIDNESIENGFTEVSESVDGININDPVEFLETINQNLIWIKGHTTKIGNAQRQYFQFFFRGLFNSQDDAYQNMTLAASAALQKLQSQIL